nr:hypothetical protein [Frisingicoccus sp.]
MKKLSCLLLTLSTLLAFTACGNTNTNTATTTTSETVESQASAEVEWPEILPVPEGTVDSASATENKFSAAIIGEDWTKESAMAYAKLCKAAGFTQVIVNRIYSFQYDFEAVHPEYNKVVSISFVGDNNTSISLKDYK